MLWRSEKSISCAMYAIPSLRRNTGRSECLSHLIHRLYTDLSCPRPTTSSTCKPKSHTHHTHRTTSLTEPFQAQSYHQAISNSTTQHTQNIKMSTVRHSPIKFSVLLPGAFVFYAVFDELRPEPVDDTHEGIELEWLPPAYAQPLPFVSARLPAPRPTKQKQEVVGEEVQAVLADNLFSDEETVAEAARPGSSSSAATTSSC